MPEAAPRLFKPSHFKIFVYEAYVFGLLSNGQKQPKLLFQNGDEFDEDAKSCNVM